jgi:hypothetical protein
MTERDINIISMVYEYEGCGIAHIRQLFFQGARNQSIPCYRRLAYLVKQGYLKSILVAALQKHVLIPGTKARGILSQLMKGSELKGIRIESPLFMQHKLALCDVRVALELTTKTSPLFLFMHWINESELRRALLSVTDPDTQKQILLIPDAALTLTLASGSTADFLSGA